MPPFFCFYFGQNLVFVVFGFCSLGLILAPFGAYASSNFGNHKQIRFDQIF